MQPFTAYSKMLMLVLAFATFSKANGQYTDSSRMFQTIPMSAQQAEGLPVRSVIIVLHKAEGDLLADSVGVDNFYKAFGLRPGASYNQYFADLAVRTIADQPDINNADINIYAAEWSGPLVLVINVYYLKPGQSKSVGGKKGMTQTRSIRDFPNVIETSRAKLQLIFNGGIGLFNEVNALFSKGPEFTNGNPIATDPATKGVRFWSEAFLEPGIAGITQIGKSKLYAYGAASVLISGRNASDIYSYGPTTFVDIERAYAGLLGTRLGKNQHINFDISAGRQFFQLNDGFLISKFSGSANAGERGSVYLNSRTAFEKTVLAKLHIKNWMFQFYFLEPQELFKNRQSNTNYTGGGITYNNNKNLDAGLYYIKTSGGTSKYSRPQGPINKKGMFILNPKLWIKNIANTGLFFKTEYAYQSHSTADMQSSAWYVGAGIKKDSWRMRPSLYYRYAFMQGDDSLTLKFEKFDPILTGGLGNWVQGINFRKVSGNGNIISHRIELKIYPVKNLELSVDYFLLQSNTASNLGALPPITTLKGKNYGHEITVSPRYFLNNHFMLLGVLSYGIPGDGLRNAFDDKLYNWTSIQTALFMFF
jgi:hypothetical protein